MHHARPSLLCVLVLAAPVLAPQPSAWTAQASAATSAADLSIYRTLIDDSNAARAAGDYAGAREMALEVVTYLLARPAAEQDAAWLALLDSAGVAAWYAQDARMATSAWKRVCEVRSAALPDDHPELQRTRQRLAASLYMLGDLAGARALEEQVLAVQSRTLPDDHPDLQVTRGSLAATLGTLGDVTGARALQEQVLAVLSRTLPDDHAELQKARLNLATTLYMLGDLAGARELQEQALAVLSRMLPDEHPDLQAARGNLATTLNTLGDHAGARELQEQALAVLSRMLPDDHPDLQLAWGNLAATLFSLGDLAGARELQEQVLAVRSRTLPDDHPDLQLARGNLAGTLYMLGDLAGARALQEQVLVVRSRLLPDDHPHLHAARGNLAATLGTLGDLAGARALQEQVLAVLSHTLPDDHPELQAARGNLARTIKALGDLAGARALEGKVLAVLSRTLPDDHPDLHAARGNLGATLYMLGDLAGAHAEFERVLAVLSRTLPDDHPELQWARLNLAATIKALGDLTGARALEEQVLAVRSRTLPDDHPDLQWARGSLAATIVSQLARASPLLGGRERCVELIGDLCGAQVHAACEAILASPGREAEERCSSLAKWLDTSLSFASGYGVFESLSRLDTQSFVLAETTRGAALASAELARRAAGAQKYTELREALREASDELAGLAQRGTTSGEFDRARMRRESVERELVALARELSGGQQSVVELDVERLAARLDGGEATLSFRRFTKWRVEVLEELDSTGQPALRTTSVASLCAFVVRSSKAATSPDSAPASPLMLVDLGPIAPIEAAARAWRAAIGVGLERGLSAGDAEIDRAKESGEELRRLVLDPLLASLSGTDHIVVALDDVLHLVPLDALPLADSAELVGDRWRIETRATLTELMMDSPAPTGTALVALGGASFNVEPVALSAEDVASVEESEAGEADESHRGATLLRGTAWERGFAPLTHTGDEARGIGALYQEIYEGERPALVLEKRKASRAALVELAPKARYLHIATHGWFAPESIRSWSDPEPIDKQSGLGARMSGEEQVKGMSPMLLCGLALAGANLPEDAVGRAPGLVTADELATLDLSNCELAVLSACDTNVGERRAGQGVASLQKALQMAGARSVITSLWKVPDEATKVLMLDFYRRLWVEQKPKHRALWEAKKKLREAQDERGAPLYTTRDWAAWVLTGAPE